MKNANALERNIGNQSKTKDMLNSFEETQIYLKRIEKTKDL